MTMIGETDEIVMIVDMSLTAGTMIAVVTAMMATEGIVVTATGAETVLRFVPSLCMCFSRPLCAIRIRL